MTTLHIYDRVRRIAPGFACAVREAAARAHNESEFSRPINNELERLGGELGICLTIREQYTLASGRADAVFNRVVVEYKAPGALRDSLSHQATARAVQQLRDYVEDLARETRRERDRFLGVVTDGHYFIFVRYHQGHWTVEPPLPVNDASCERFLRSFFSLAAGRALVPENLVEDFGNQNPLSREVTAALYRALERHPENLTACLFAQWRLFFGQTAGYEAAAGQLQHRSELRAFLGDMGLSPETADLPRFFFALQTYFAFIVKTIARLVLQAYAGGALGAAPLTTVAG